MRVNRESKPLPKLSPEVSGGSRPKTTTSSGLAEVASGFEKSPAQRTGPALETPVPERSVGPVELDSAAAQAAIAKSFSFLGSIDGEMGFAKPADAFSPRSVFKDEQGMTHVRLDRMHEGMKVFGEQVVSHLGADGEVASVNGDTDAIPAGLGRVALTLSPEQAIKVAQEAFAKHDAKDVKGRLDQEPRFEEVIYRANDGSYRKGYRVELSNLTQGKGPKMMNYLVDGQTGKIDDRWNQTSGFFRDEAAELLKAPGLPPLFDGQLGETLKDLIALGQFDDAAFLRLCASAGDKRFVSADKVATELAKPELTRTARFEMVKGGMTVKESHDLALVLDSGMFKLPPHQQNFLEALVGRAPLKTSVDLADRGIELVFTELKAKDASIDDQTVLSLLAAAGDRPSSSALKTEAKLATLSRPELIDFVKQGLTQQERSDLAQLLDYQPLPMTAGARNLLESVLGRAALNAVDDTAVYCGKVDVPASKGADGLWRLEDKSRGKGVATFDAMNAQDGARAQELTDANNVWGEATDSARQAAAVDAQYLDAMFSDFLKETAGIDSLDGKGLPLVNYVHVRTNFVNAFWQPGAAHPKSVDGGKGRGAKFFGDGDGKRAGHLADPDVMPHEGFHGVTTNFPGLIYRGESGGLNEAASDIASIAFTYWLNKKNPAVKFNYTIGDQCWTPTNGDDTDGLRYANDPTKDKYSIDNYKNYPQQTEVHGSSGIGNNMFFLLCEGGVNRTSKIEVKGGIGVEKAWQIFTRAHLHYMTPSTTFAQARQAMIKAATDLFGADSAEAAKVGEVWTAVGVN